MNQNNNAVKIFALVTDTMKMESNLKIGTIYNKNSHTLWQFHKRKTEYSEGIALSRKFRQKSYQNDTSNKIKSTEISKMENVHENVNF